MADFEKIEIDPSAVEAKYARPDFAKVVFHNICETYPTDVNIECQYMITASLTPHGRDWVGLYKVGWSSVRDYVYFLWAPMPDSYNPGTELDSTVVFQASCLPKDDGEFYQFCYVSSSGHVRGASTPFQFKKPSAEDYVEVVDEDSDMMVIKCKTVALQEDLTEARKERDVLLRKIKIVEAERDSLLSKVVMLEKDLKSEKQSNGELQDQLKEMQDKLASVQVEARDMAMAHDGLKEKLNVLNQEKESILKRLDDNDKYISDLQEKLKNLLSEKDALAGRTKALEQEKEMLQNHFTSSENTIKGYLGQVMSLKQQLEKQTENDASKQRELEYLRSELETTQMKIRDLHTAAKKDKTEKDSLKERLHNSEDQLNALEKCKVMLHEEIEAVRAAHHKMSQDLEISKSETHSSNALVKRLKMTHKEERETWEQAEQQYQKVIQEKGKEQERLMEEIKKLEASPPASPVEEKDGSMFALQTSLDHLKARYARIKRDKEALNKQVDDLVKNQKTMEAVEADLRSDVRDLRERLMMGAEEYKAKYLECRKLQSEIKALKKSARKDRSSKSPSIEVQTEKALSESNGVQTDEDMGATPKVQMSDDEEDIVNYKQLFQKTSEEIEDLRKTHEYEMSRMEYELEAQKIEKGRLGEELKRRLKEQEAKHQREIDRLRAHLDSNKTEVKTTGQSVEMGPQTCLCSIHGKALSTCSSTQTSVGTVVEQVGAPKPLRVQVAASSRGMYPGVAVMQPPITTAPTATCTELHEVVVTTPPKVPPRTYRRSTPPAPQNSASSTADPSPASSPTVVRHIANLAAAMDPMNASQGPEDLSPPMTPLPPPIEPQRLHTSRLAKVKAVISKDFPGRATPVIRAESDDGFAKDSCHDNNGNDQLITIEDSDAEDSDERFHDAAGEAQKLCPVCNMVFPADHPQAEFETHIENHYDAMKTCPVCDEKFKYDYDQTKFEQHVNDHFKETRN